MKLLCQDTVGQRVARPIRVLQFGGGNFLRAFASYLVESLNTEADFNGGVALVKPTEKGDYSKLRQQDGLFHVIAQGISDGQPVREIERINCIQEIIHPYHDWAAYCATATLPELRFVISNTTEAGIAFKEEPKPTAGPAHEFPGKLAQWLHHRYDCFEGAADKGCVILPCELIEQNGDELKAKVLAYAKYWQLGDGFQEWVEAHNIFCNTLVDRIVPGAPGDPSPVWSELGVEDHQLVTAEPYLLWAIQAPKSVQVELPFNRTAQNVIFTADLSRYRTLKVRILNGAHTAMVPVGLSQGITTVREFVEHPDWGTWLNTLLKEEVAPTLPYEPDEIEHYIATVTDRFRNPYIHHKLADIALNSISKFRVRLLPTVKAYHLQTGEVPTAIATALAALIWLYKGDCPGLPKDDPDITQWFQQIWAEQDLDGIVDKSLNNSALRRDFDLSFLSAAVAGHLEMIIKQTTAGIPQK